MPDRRRVGQGRRRSSAGGYAERRYAIGFCVFLALCALGGGSARADVQSLLFVRVGAVLFAATCLLTLPEEALSRLRAPLAAIGVAALAVAVQLVPFPHDWWAALPGRERYDVAGALELARGWRPISLTPDLTLNTLLSLLPAAAAAIGVAAMGRTAPRWVPAAVLAAAAVSAALGLVQLAAPPGSPLRFYAITNATSAVGLFANRNHAAVFIAVALPMLAAWSAARTDRRDLAPWAPWIALAAGSFLLVAGLVTASRAGVLITALAVPLSVLLYRRSATPQPGQSPFRRLPPPVRWAAIAAPIFVLGLMAALIARSAGFGRLLGTELVQEERVAWLTPLTAMLRSFFPMGAGFGAFPSVYRGFEPFALLDRTYLNAAHNDLAQLLIEGGLAGAALLIAYLVWWSRAAWRTWHSSARDDLYRASRAASVVTGLLLVASLFDYPLRTPLLAVVFVAASMLMRSPSALPSSRERLGGGSFPDS